MQAEPSVVDRGLVDYFAGQYAVGIAAFDRHRKQPYRPRWHSLLLSRAKQKQPQFL